jgi:hypothetical protein
MKDFIYQNVIDEFRQYLDFNLEETVYFESLRIKFHEVEDDTLEYRSIIRKEIFRTSRVLDNSNNIAFSSEIRKLGKVRKYEDYCLNTIEELEKEVELINKLNSIQAISTISLLDKKNLFKEIQKEISKLPTSVKVTTKNFEFLFNDDPFESLSELFDLISDKRFENLYFNYNRYYLSNNDLKNIINHNLTSTEKKGTAFVTALLYVFLKYEETFLDINSDIDIFQNITKKISRSIPSELNKRYNIIEIIIQNLSTALRKTSDNNES